MKALSSFIVILAFLMPVAAVACPGCIAANEESRNAFLFTTALMTFVPLIGLAIAIRFLQARARRVEEEAKRTENVLFERS